MNNNTFERVVEDSLDMCKAVLTRKSGEYSSSDDKLHNFNKAKELMRCKTKEFALLGMLNKHLVSVIDMIEKFEKTGELPTSNMIDEKIGDSINYFILLKACFYDDLKKAEKTTFKDDIRSLLKEEKKQIEIERLIKEEAAQQECDNRNKSEQDVKDMFDTASDLTTAMVVNKRKKAVVDNMQDKLKPIIEYLQIVEPKQYQYFSNLCFQEIQKHNSITDEVFYKATIDFLNSLMLPDKEKLPQYKFRTMKQIRDSIVKQLRDELEKM